MHNHQTWSGRHDAPAEQDDSAMQGDDGGAPPAGPRWAWAIVSPAGRILNTAIRPRPEEAVRAVARNEAAWREMLAAGYRTRRVVVSEVAVLPRPIPRRLAGIAP